jgi:hypothetical protein
MGGNESEAKSLQEGRMRDWIEDVEAGRTSFVL